MGVGLVSYGPQDRHAGLLLTPQPTGEWYDYPVAPRLAELLDRPGDVELNEPEATTLLEELRASGRRWVFGTDEARPLPSMTPPEPEPQPEPEPERRPGFFTRLLGKGD
jgi:hypothetical protein